MIAARFAPLLALGLLLGACAYPVTRTTTLDERPTLSLSAAPAGSQLYVNNVLIGPAEGFAAGKGALRLEPGTHTVRIQNGGAVLFENRVYLGSGSHKTLDLNLGQ